MTDIGPHRVHLPQEVVDMICAHLDETNLEDDVLQDRNPSTIKDLKNCRLVNTSFAAGGAPALFRHLTIPFSPSTEAGRRGEYAVDFNTWPGFEIYQGLEHVSRLAASRFARMVKTVTISVSHGEYHDDPVASKLSLLSNFTNFCNIQVLRYRMTNYDTSREEPLDYQKYYDLKFWHCAIASHLCPKIHAPQRILYSAPSWATFILTPAGILRHANLHFSESVHFRARNSSFHVGYGELSIRYLTIVWRPASPESLQNVLWLDFGDVSAPQLGYLNLRGVHVGQTLAGFIDRSRARLRKVDLDELVAWPERAPTDWDAIFRALGRCRRLRDLTLSNQIIDTTGLWAVPARKPRLRFLKLDNVDILSNILAHLIKTNKDTLVHVVLIETCLDNYLNGEDLAPEVVDPDWLSVLDALLRCSKLSQLRLWALQFSAWEVEKDMASLEGLTREIGPEDILDDYTTLAESIPFPIRARQIYHCRHEAFAMSRDVYHKIGELVRMVRGRRQDWGGATELEKFTPWCTEWFAALYPLADVKSGRATSLDVYPWDPVNGLRVEELADGMSEKPVVEEI